MWHHHNFIDEDGYLKDMGEDLEQQFSEFGNVEMAREWSPLEALKSMIQSNVLIICASSFSYVAGLLRLSQLTISPVFFHTSPSSWKSISGSITTDELIGLRQVLAERWP